MKLWSLFRKCYQVGCSRSKVIVLFDVDHLTITSEQREVSISHLESCGFTCKLVVECKKHRHMQRQDNS